MALKIGDKVQHINAKWMAKVSGIKHDYAYGLGKRTAQKMNQYTLKDLVSRKTIMGTWSDKEIKKVR